MDKVNRDWTMWAMRPETRRIKRRAFMAGWMVWLAVALFIVGALYAPARADLKMEFTATCSDSAELGDALKERYGEVPVWRALISTGELLVIYQAESGSWTAVAINPAGIGCMFAVGAAAQAIDPEPEEDPDA